MDIVDFTDKIHKLEVEYCFFEVQDSEGLAYWDIVRHDVFYAVYYELANISINRNIGKRDFFSTVYTLIQYAKESLKMWRIKKKYKYLCFTCSRNKTEFQQNIDYILKDVIELLQDSDRLILETNIKFQEEFYYTSIFNVGPFITIYKQKLKQRIFGKFDIENLKISRILKEKFNVNFDLDTLINALIINYKAEYGYYTSLFKRTNPEKIFLVQNGIQKGLFRAAIDLNIPVYEFQHGLVSYIHPAYDYPKTLHGKFKSSFPRYFLTFSEFWSNNINYPVKKKVVTGNNFFAQKLPKIAKQFEIAFISANIYSEDLNNLLMQLLKGGYKEQVILKLHPNQYSEKESTKKLFSEYINIKVIYDEITIKEVLQTSKAILAVQSTCVYEALDNELKVLLYKIKDYTTHQDVFDNPNVYQISNSSEIKSYLKRNYIFDKQFQFFEDLKKGKFLDILNTSHD